MFFFLISSCFAVPDDPKNAFLKQLENATERLRLFKADVLDGGSLTAAFAGCEGVFHPATPVPEEQMVDPEASIYLCTHHLNNQKPLVILLSANLHISAAAADDDDDSKHDFEFRRR